MYIQVHTCVAGLHSGGKYVAPHERCRVLFCFQRVADKKVDERQDLPRLLVQACEYAGERRLVGKVNRAVEKVRHSACCGERRRAQVHQLVWAW